MRNKIYVKQYFRVIFTSLFSLLFFISCFSAQPRAVASIEYKIPEVFNFDEDDIKNQVIYKSDDTGYNVVIVFYSYFPVVEVINYSGDELITKTKPGELKALIRVMDNDKIVKVYFVEVTGEGKDNLLREFSKKAGIIFSKQD